jgi:hypothetical protein
MPEYIVQVSAQEANSFHAAFLIRQMRGLQSVLKSRKDDFHKGSKDFEVLRHYESVLRELEIEVDALALDDVLAECPILSEREEESPKRESIYSASTTCSDDTLCSIGSGSDIGVVDVDDWTPSYVVDVDEWTPGVADVDDWIPLRLQGENSDGDNRTTGFTFTEVHVGDLSEVWRRLEDDEDDDESDDCQRWSAQLPELRKLGPFEIDLDEDFICNERLVQSI